MKTKTCVLALAALLAGGMIGINNMSIQNASAGWMSTDVLDNSALSGSKLNQEDWSIDDGISLKSGKILFAKDSYEDTKLLYRTQLYADVEESTYTIKATLGVQNMAGEKRFGIGFGFDRQRYIVGDENTNYVYVEKSGSGYVAGVCSYNEDADKTELVTSPKALKDTEWAFEIVATYPNLMTVTVGGETLYEGETTAEDLSGYFGFLETGDTTDKQYSEGYVSSVFADNDYYDTPENVNINDDFEDGSINSAVWYLGNNAPYMKGVAETDGMLRFIDNNMSTLTTKYEYSNFEMSLDIPYVKKTTEFNEDGSLRSPACCWFGFFCGLQVDSYDAITNVDRILTNNYPAYFLSFRGNVDGNGVAQGGTDVLFGLNLSRTTYSLPKKYDLWDLDNEDKVLNVLFTCIDGTYTLDIKWEDETEYYHVFTAKYSVMTGYITLCGYGSGALNGTLKSNFAYDNVKITNRDYKGNVLSGIEKESENVIPDGKTDYGYADSKLPAQLVQDGTDFDNEGTPGESVGCTGVLDIGTVSVATFACAVALLERRKRK